MATTPRRAFHDDEMSAISRICNQLAFLKPEARRRVMSYVMARSESLPVLAAVGGGAGDEPVTAPLFDGDAQETEAPMMPSLAGARG